MRAIRLATIQYPQRPIDGFAAFASQVELYVRIAADYRCDLVLFPELFTLQLLSAEPALLPAPQAIDALTAHTPALRELFVELAQRYAINVIGGSHIERDHAGTPRNVCYVALRDGSLHMRPKLHPTPNEREWWGIEGGDDARVGDTDCGALGIAICYDSEFPEHVRHLADQGAKLVCVPFCTDVRAGYLRVRHCSAARAIENQCYVALSGSVGTLPGVANFDIQWSESCVLTPCDFGFPPEGIACTVPPNTEGVAFADLDYDAIERTRSEGSVRNLADRRPELYARWRG